MWATELPIEASAEFTEAIYAPYRAVAARTAVEIAMPFVMALVVLPAASRSVRTCAAVSSMSPDISPMPWALSEAGPDVSMATITPTVGNSPQPARALKNNAMGREPPDPRHAPELAAALTPAGQREG